MQTLHEGRTTARDESSSVAAAGADRKEDGLDGGGDFSDELLVVVGFRKGGFARRVSAGGLARIEEKSGKSCAVM